METSKTSRVWFVPPKFWMQTKDMTFEESQQLLDHVMSLSEESDLESLKKYDFIVVGDA
jgi:hypothetical protein